MNISGVVPLDEQSLVESAIRATGLSDFGDNDWREPFLILVKSLEEEADLNLMGRIRTRSELLQLLEARLQIEDTYKRHPEIEEEVISQPIFVVAQGRSGTSFLLNVLAAHPDNGVMQHWENFFPCPPPEKANYESDPRIERADQLIKQWVRVTPEIASMHEFGGRIPFECTHTMALAFRALGWFGALGQTASYAQYIVQQDITIALRYQERVLKILQWKNPRRHWVLKDILLLEHVDSILKVHPNACIVLTHRDPVRALASMVNLVGTFQWGRSDHPFQGHSLEFITDPTISAQRLNTLIDQIEQGVVPKERICSLQYKDLVADPMATIETMYRHFEIPLTAEGRHAMQKYLTDNPRDERPPHRFKAGSEDAIAKARKAYKRYQDYFNVQSE